MLVVNVTQLVKELADLKTAQLDGGKLRLYKNDIQPSPTTLIAAFTEADFTGYAAITIATWGAAFQNAIGNGQVIAPSQQFNQSGVGVTNNIYGYWYETAAGVLLWSERFAAAPVPMDATGKALVLILTRENANQV